MSGSTQGTAAKFGLVLGSFLVLEVGAWFEEDALGGVVWSDPAVALPFPGPGLSELGSSSFVVSVLLAIGGEDRTLHVP